MPQIHRFICSVFFIFFGLILSSLLSYADNKTDSLKLLVKSQTDTNKINTLFLLVGSIPNINPEDLNKYAKEILDLSGKINYAKGMGNGYTCLGLYNDKKNNFKKAIEYYKLSDSIFSGINFIKGSARCKKYIGKLYFKLNEYQKSLKYDLLAARIFEKLNDAEQLGNCFANIGQIYEYQKNNPMALEYYQKALVIAKKIHWERGISSLINNIGNIYLSEKNYEKALLFYTESLEMDKKLGDSLSLSYSYINIGNVYLEQKNLTKAEDYFRLFLSLANQTGNKNNLAIAYQNLAEIYIHKSKYKEAIEYFDISYKYALDKNDSYLIKETYNSLAYAYSEIGNYKMAYEYSTKYAELKDSIFNEESLAQMAEMQTKYDSEKKEKEIEILTRDKENKDLRLKKNRILIILFIVGSSLLLLLSMFIFFAYRNKRRTTQLLQLKNHEIEEKNEELHQQNEEIRTQRDEIESQRDEITAQRDLVTSQKTRIEHIHEELTDSILYALQIQTSILPNQQYIQERIPGDFFVLFKPKDIVSGDFYFIEKRLHWLLISVADCTGHGVPGAFMSMLGVSFLNEIIAKENVQTAGRVLDELREHVIHSLQQKGISGEQKDGMDIAFVVINTLTNEMQFSGANNSLLIVKKLKVESEKNTENNFTNFTTLQTNDFTSFELYELKGDKMPVSIHERMDNFSNHTIQLQKGDIFYMMSDGYADQFGGPKGKKFFSKNLRQLLSANSYKPMAEQKEIIDNTIEDWKNIFAEKYEQTDDITVLGVKINI